MNILQFILTTIEVLNAHWEATVSSRLPGTSQGSRFPQFDSAEDLTDALKKADWEDARTTNPEWFSGENPIIRPGCDAYIAKIPGENGMIELKNLDDDVEVKLIDPKNIGKLSACVYGVDYVKESHTVMIVGDNEGHRVVFTFHPGDPTHHSTIEGEERTVTVREARELGFDLAKIEQ